MASFWSAKRISVLLTIIAVVLWSYGVAQAELNIGFYGLVHSFSISFFVALGLLTTAAAILWVSPQSHSRLLCLQLLVLVVSLWLVPVLIGGTPSGGPWHYRFTSFAEYVVRVGHLNPQVFAQDQWPGSIILNASLASILGLKYPASMVKWAPFGLNLAFSVALYLFFKHALPENRKNYCWAGLWVFQLGNWWTAVSLWSQSIAYLLFFFVLAFLVKSISRQGFTLASERLTSILFLAGTVVTHLLTSLVTGVALAGLQIAKRIKASSLVALGAVLVVASLIYVGTLFEARLPHLLDTIFRFDILLRTRAQSILGTVGSDSSQAVARVRLLTLILFLVIGVSGFVWSRIKRRDAHLDNAVLVMALAPIIAGVFLGMSYGSTELLNRIWIFVLPAVAYFGMKLLSSRPTAVFLCALLLIGSPLFFVSEYGTQIGMYIPPSQFAAEEFFYKETKRGEIVTDTILEGLRNSEKYRLVELTVGLSKDPTLLSRPITSPPRYVTISSLERNRIEGMYGSTELITNAQISLEQGGAYNLIYVNPDLSLYIGE